ncbi:hypothetical protein DM806_11495 [Sphingobium lactosutens]|uniref:hypothetical protein n=1 Tax=Sphingobium lactosutens TaxID=522773 RepID=UPI0015BB8BA3|nr:hypothetical protein [Sphingobium lactosutens]NWK96273.1 hypothetical protein [Sphingobium lactosutens]
MLTKADDYPIHQTPEPVAFSGTDRNFYDRYFFNGFEPDGSIFFMIALGLYPHLNIIDCNFSILVDGRQHCLRGSRILNSERMDISVGPMRLDIVEPLRVLRFTVAEQNGIAADISFKGRSFPIQEPRFTRRIGTRAFQDVTRMTQNGRWSGWISIDGRRIDLSDLAMGTRDRSWGVRPIGDSDTQTIVPAGPQGYFWQWTPVSFSDFSLFYHISAEPDGTIWNRRSALAFDDAGADHHRETLDTHMETTLEAGTVWPEHGLLTSRFGADIYQVEFRPFQRFQMKGAGYFHPEWYHGRYHGALRVEREDFDVDPIDPAPMQNWHVQRLSQLTLTRPDGRTEQSVGVFEQAIIGAYEPLGVKSDREIARWDQKD